MSEAATNIRGGGARQSGTYVRVPERPGPARCEPTDARKVVTASVSSWFREWCMRRRITQRDLASIIDVTHSVAGKKLSGLAPVTLVDVAHFPDRERDDLLCELRRHCDFVRSVHGG